MNLLFIQGGSRWKLDELGNVYTDSNFNEFIWERYRYYCDKLTVILRREEKIYSSDEAKRRFNVFDVNKSNYVALPDLYQPVTNVLSFNIRKKIKSVIEEEVKKADKIIIRSLGNIYTNTALKCARKYHKSYMVEVTGFAWESMWYHSLRGKIVALPKELQYRALMKDVPYAVYVTEEALQKRYPCTGKSLGCSDVELPTLDENILKSRLKKINEEKSKIVIGTAAFLDVGWKGQEYVIRALAELKKYGNDQFEYQLIGGGTGRHLMDVAKNLGVENQIIIIGLLPHDKVFEWLDSIDVYVQPSFMEGLCRSLVEAMSRACPIVCTDVGGNYELASQDNLFKKADYRHLADILKTFTNKEKMEKEAKRCFEKAKEYDKKVLDERRDVFYKEIMGV